MPHLITPCEKGKWLSIYIDGHFPLTFLLYEAPRFSLIILTLKGGSLNLQQKTE